MAQVLKTSSRKHILVTGASGFVGGALLARLLREGNVHLRGAVRRAETTRLPAGVEPVLVGDLAAGTDWADALKNVHVVVHAAARVQVMRAASASALLGYRRANVAGTLNLARQAVEKGVRRPVSVSATPGSEMAALVAKGPCGRTTPPGDGFAFGAAVRAAFEDRAKLEEEGRHGRDLIEREYSKEAVARRYDTLIRELTAS